MKTSRTPALGRGRIGIAVLASSLAVPCIVAAQGWSTWDVSIEETILNQCTGVPAAIVLDGSIRARPKSSNGGGTISVQVKLKGSASDDVGTQYRLSANENVDVAGATPPTEVEVWANLRFATRGGPNVHVGHDRVTIAIGESGEIEHVDHRIDFACD